MNELRHNFSLKAVLDLLDAQLADELDILNCPGMSAALVMDQEMIWSKAYGYADMEKKVPATTEHLFRIGSVTKLFTATMLMYLRDAGKLNLDDALEKFEPRFKIKSRFPDSRPPTFRQVVSHTAGIPRESTVNVWAELKDFPEAGVFLDALAEAEMTFPAYSQFKYSNLGVGLLGHVLAEAAGQPYREYVQENILQPMGMNNTGFDLTDEVKNSLAVGYLPSEDGKEFDIAPLFDLGGLASAGQMYSTASDLAKFVSLQFSEKTAGEAQVLGGSTLREMHAPVFLSSEDGEDSGVGIGWLFSKAVAGHRVIGHSGGVHGFSCNIYLVPDLKLGFIVLTNSMSQPVEISRKALDLLVPVLDRLQKQAAIRAQRNFVAPEEWEQYTGDYTFAGQFMKLVINEGKFYFTDSEDHPEARADMTFEKEHVFRTKGGPVDGELAEFLFDAEGNVTHVQMGGYLLEKINK